MASRAELEQLRKALNRLSVTAQAELAAQVAGLDPVATRRVLMAAYPQIVAEFGTASAALAADMVEAWASELGIRPSLVLSPGVVPDRATWGVSRAFGLPDPMGNLLLDADKLVKRPYRETVQQSAHASRAAWARVPSGAKTCSFCSMTASRGAVYRSSGSAGGDHKFHGGCDCQVVMVRGPEDFPDGYDPGDLFQSYQDARDGVEGRKTTSAILSQMRVITGSN